MLCRPNNPNKGAMVLCQERWYRLLWDEAFYFSYFFIINYWSLVTMSGEIPVNVFPHILSMLYTVYQLYKLKMTVFKTCQQINITNAPYI